MENLIIENNLVPMDNQPYEAVERKGIGHPDTLADGVAETISIEYSQYCLKNFGAVLHHHLDKTVFMGGRAKINFGIGKMQKPFRLLINGRISDSFANDPIDYKKIQIRATKKYLKQVLPNFDSDKWLKIYSHTTSYSRSPVWYHPQSLEDLPERTAPYANDTSCIVGYWPLSKTENLALKIERFFYKRDNSPKFDFIGHDIKVLAVRTKNNIDVTTCIPFMSSKIPDREYYYLKVDEIQKKLTELAINYIGKAYKINIYINTQDQRLFEGPKRGTSHYFTVTGSALDYGEEGVVGRGNRNYGLISCIRPSSTDAICGKNPSFHVGKVYAFFANSIARDISEKFSCESFVTLVSQNKRALAKPLKIIVDTDKKINQKKIEEIIENNLQKDWIDGIVNKKFFLPLPGGTHGYQA